MGRMIYRPIYRGVETLPLGPQLAKTLKFNFVKVKIDYE